MHKHSSSQEICKVRRHDIPLTPVEMTDTLCSFTRNVTCVTCFLLPKKGSIAVMLLTYVLHILTMYCMVICMTSIAMHNANTNLMRTILNLSSLQIDAANISPLVKIRVILSTFYQNVINRLHKNHTAQIFHKNYIGCC